MRPIIITGKISFPAIILLVFGINLLLLTIPLTNITGYENSAVNAIILFIASGIMTIWYLRAHSNIKANLYYIYLAGLWFLPLIMAAVNTIIFQVCPVAEGSVYYPVIILPALFAGIAAAYLSCYLSQRFSYLIFFLFFLILVALPTYEIYFYPQIYFYHPVIGFFPGTIYDEDIPIDFKLLLYRLFVLLASIAIIFVIKRFYGRKKLIISAAILSLGLLFFFLKPELGLATDNGRMEKELGGKAEFENFRIIYDINIPREKLDVLFLHHRYYYNEIKNTLGYEPEEKIASFIFSGREQKRELFGAGNADVSKPWMRQIYTDQNSYDGTLKHELVHAFSGEIGVTPFKVAEGFNPAMIEGYAMAVENDFDNMDIDYIAAIANNAGLKVELSSLFSGLNFFGVTSGLSYIYSGSYIKYIANKYGYDKVNRLYYDADISKVLGINPDSLEKDYWTYLNGIPVQPNPHKAFFYFGYKPLIRKICPRYLAIKTREAWELYNRESYGESEELFFQLTEYTDSYSAFTGYVQSLLKNGKPKKAEEFLESKIENFRETSYYYNMELILSDIYIKNRKYKNSMALLDSLITQAPRQDYVNSAFVRKTLIETDTLSANAFTGGDYSEKFAILRSLLIKDIDHTAPLLIAAGREAGVSYSEILKYLNGQDIISYYSLFRISEYAIENNDFDTALEYAEKAERLSLETIYESYGKELTKKIDWFIANRDE